MSLKSKLLLNGIDDEGGTHKSNKISKSSSFKYDKHDRFQRVSFEGGSNLDQAENNIDDQLQNEQSKVESVGEAGHEFMIWEPKGLKQKFFAFWNNSFEVSYVLVSALIALINSSVIAAFFFLLSTAMLMSHNQSLELRYLYGLIILIAQIICVFTIIIFKMIFAKYMVKVYDKPDNYAKNIKIYQSIGYTLIENNSLSFQIDITYSFQMEFSLLFIMICAFIYMFIKRKNLIQLKNTDPKKIKELINLENPAEDDDNERKRNGIGTSQLDLSDRQQTQNLLEDIENNKRKLKALRKEIKKNFVESQYFYNLNQWFFMLSLLFQLIQMMSFVTLLDLPILIIVLVLVAFYDLRKNYTVIYRSYCFFVVYWMQTVMIIKLIHDILVRTYFIKTWLENKQHCETVVSKMNQILFGSEWCQNKEDNRNELANYLIGIFISIFCCQCWKNTKWMEIREKTQNIKGVSSIQRFLIYVRARQQEDIETKIFASQIQEEKQKQLNERVWKKKEEKKKSQSVTKGKYDVGKSFQKAKNDKSKYLPVIVLWLCRINLFVLSYMYHSGLGFLNLVWVIFSFLLTSQTTFFISTFIMVPLLTWEFLIIYGARVPIIKGQPIFKIMDSYFQWDMENYQALELVYMYVSLAIFYVQISCFIKSIQPQTEELNLLEFFRKRIQSPKYSIAWKYIFLCCPYIQTIFLLALFIKGASKLNTLVNLGYMIFFVVYTAYIQIYRKTGFILVIFVSFFILSQYFVSLNYKLYMKNEIQVKSLYWFNVFPYDNLDNDKIFKKNPFNIKNEKSMYWRLNPQYFDWMILILMSVLNQVNQMYNNSKKVQMFTEECLEGIKEKIGKVSYYYQRVKNIVTGLMIYLAMGSMILVHQFIETNFINWLFFVLNLSVFAMMIFSQRNAKSLNNLLNISIFTKYFALNILILMILFILFIGSREKIDQPGSLDQKFKRNFSQTYEMMKYIGFRSFNLLGYTESEDQTNVNIRQKLMSYVWFFMISLYLCSHFEQELKVSQENDNFDEKDYKKLFEYYVPKKEDSNHNESQDILKESAKVLQQQKEDENNKSIYKKKDKYVQKDLYEFYEGTRFTLPFMVYRYVEYWSIFDFIAKNGHFLNYLIMVLNALYFQTSIYMCINIVLICIFYLQSSRNLSKRVTLNNQFSGLQSQCDIKMTQLITKRYKSEQFYEFLKLRKIIWKIQFSIFMLSIVIGYPTKLLHQLATISEYAQEGPNKENLKIATFWFFISGLMKPLVDTNYTYQSIFFSLLFGLIFDRVTINWLTNRFGCNYFKLQKFIELDQRREAIRYNWETRNPAYDIERYQKLYYLNDFEDLKERFQSRNYHDTAAQKKSQNDDKKKGLVKYQLEGSEKKYQENLYGDFVPPKVGLRILKIVEYSVQLDCQAPGTNQDDDTKFKLKYYDKDQKKEIEEREQEIELLKEQLEFETDENIKKLEKKIQRKEEEIKMLDKVDFEEIEILKDFKIQQLKEILQENIDLKYKISYSKGMMLVYEQLILLMMSVSLVLKANIFSLIYLVFIIKNMYSTNKPKLFPRINNYLAICFGLQYVLYLINLTTQTTAIDFPAILKNDIFDNSQPKHLIPLFFHFEDFKTNMMLGYLIGIGIEKTQIYNLLIDFFILYCTSAYVIEFSNPIFLRSMKKVFWQYPTSHDSQKQWDRLDKTVKQQVLFFRNPKKSDDQSLQNQNDQQKSIKQGQFNFAVDYKKYTKLDLDYLLTNYVDMKYQRVWSDDFLTEIKSEMKQNSIYFRIVKQGSMLTYLSFHIFTIFVILLMALMRQSILSLIYVFMLLPALKYGSDVLDQRDAEIQRSIQKLDEQIKQNQDQLNQEEVKIIIEDELKNKNLRIDEQVTKQVNQFLKFTNDQIQDQKRKNSQKLNLQDPFINGKEYSKYTEKLKYLPTLSENDVAPFIISLVEQKRTLSSQDIERLTEDIQANKTELYILKRKLKKSNKSGLLKDDDKKQSWVIIKIIQDYLCPLAIIDFTLHVIFQLPNIQFTDEYMNQMFLWIGLKKVWSIPSDAFQTDYFQRDYLLVKRDQNYKEIKVQNLNIVPLNFANQIMICIIINVVLLQKEIFISNGYEKFITQVNGTLDFLLQISELKAKSLAYIFNNYKIKKIITIQKKREQILETVEKVKSKIVRWREFTRTTLEVKNIQQWQIENQKFDLSSTVEIKSTIYKKVNSEISNGQIEKSNSNIVQQEQRFDQLAKTRVQRLSKEDAEDIFDVLAYEFVQAKQKKLRLCVKLNQWITKNFVQLIMLKNNKKELVRLNQQHAKCFVEIPTELEKIMFDESKYLIKSQYESLEKLQELSVQCKKYKGPRTLLQRMNIQEQSAGTLSLLDITSIEKTIKLKEMKRTWDFTRQFPLLMRNIETFFYVMISQTQNFIYLGMIASMYQNAGIISVFYPISVFGYALLEETRPRKFFWDLIRKYTNVILFIKFFLNLSMFENLLQNEQFLYLNGLIQIGIYDHESILNLTLYMMPEILIISFILLNEIKQKLLGLNEETEEDIEPLQDAIQRNLMEGNEEKMYQNKIDKQNMCMQRCFVERNEQKILEKKHEAEIKNQITQSANKMDILQLENSIKDFIQSDEIIPFNMIREKYIEQKFKEQTNSDDVLGDQKEAISEISKLIWKTSRNFDLDSTGKKTKFDFFIDENVIQKSLESDNLIYVEGFRPQNQYNFLSKQQFIEEKKLEKNWENISSGDFEGDFDLKLNHLENRKKDSPSFFEKSTYFKRLFPNLKIQKPGADYYGASSVILALIIIYILFCFKYYTVNQDVFKFVEGQSSIFKGELAYTIVILIFIMMVERFASRTDTKKNENRDDLTQANEVKLKKQRFFSNSDMFYRQKTERSMTVKLQTIKTKNLDVQDDSSQNFLKQQIEQFSEASQADDQSCTIITLQQKTKYFLHWFMLIAGHLYVFWYVPITGNFNLYGQPNCNNQDSSDYGCKDFHNNLFLRILYTLLVIYLWISSIQLSLGFPIMKKPSSILQYYNDISKAGADLYISIPFACEIRCLLDWTMSKTSLDIFQFFQLYNHNYELYSAKVGNRWYGVKLLGSATPIQEKCIFSGIFSTIIILLLVGPFYLFSDNSPFVGVNPVLNGNVAVNFIINKTKENMIDIEPYNIYENQNLLLRTFTEKQWQDSSISKAVQTRNFQSKQVQECHINEYSDQKWKISNPKRRELYDNFMDKNISNSSYMNVSLQLAFKLKRALPDTSTEAYLKINRTLNYSLYHDCKAGKELQILSQLNCSGSEQDNRSTSIIIKQVYNPQMLLGITNAINEIYGEVAYRKPMELQKRKDLKLTYQCDGTWSVKGSADYTEYNQTELEKMLVYPNNCSLKQNDNQTKVTLEKERDGSEQYWKAIKLILFSMIVSTSYLAAYSPQTFYTGVVVLAFYSLRPVLIYSTWCSVVWECNNPDAIIKIVEACYLHRHEENLIAEEETYCLLREIFRSPEFIKALSGSSLKGSTSPQLDNLTQKQKEKLAHLDMLEQKGFEVTALKEKIIKSTQVQSTQN